MRKKALYIITKSNWGGAQRYVFDLATNVPSDQFEVAVAFGGTGRSGSIAGLLEKKLHEKKIRTIFIPELGRDISLGNDWRSFRALRKLLHDERPDIVHLNSSKVGGIGALAARLARIQKIIFTAHGWPFREQRTILMREALWLASWLTVLLSTKVICVSDYDLRQAQKMPFVKNKLVRIYNGIDSSPTFGSGEKIRSTFPHDAIITGTIGELTKNKNQQALIEEAKQNPDMFVAIVGEGEERAALESRIKKYNLESRVKLFGFLPAQEVLRGFDRFALPSIKEGLPYVLLEARLAGVPISANRVGGVGEILDAKDLHEFSLDSMIEKTIRVYLS
jgi:glycosyltransferase involved in cell wall biosynthesis